MWPSGHAKDYKKYIDAGNGVVDGGQLGVIGQIGWWIPTYMLTDHPELATWEGIKGNEAMFQTSESGDAGQLLDGDPSYVTFDQNIADNLGLNLKVVYAGSEAAELTELKTAYNAQKPILMYFWTPHWAQEKYDLTMVQLPEVTPECEQAAADGTDAYACAYPQDDLYKAFNQDLQTKAPAAFAFLSAMSVDQRRSERRGPGHQRRAGPGSGGAGMDRPEPRRVAALGRRRSRSAVVRTQSEHGAGGRRPPALSRA